MKIYQDVRFLGFNGCVGFENIYHVYAAMLAIVDLVVSDNRAAVRPYLDSCQGVTIDVITFNEASAITKYINATLVPIENGIAPVFGQKKLLIQKIPNLRKDHTLK